MATLVDELRVEFTISQGKLGHPEEGVCVPAKKT